jgi:hypothetical protein
VKVETEGENASIDVKLNSRPYLSWQGPLSEVTDGSVSSPVIGFPSRPRRPSANETSTQPVLRVIGLSRAAYVINSLQLKIDKGYGEPLLTPGRSYTNGRF